MTEYTLLIKPTSDDVRKYYKDHKQYYEGDSGLDLYCPHNVTFKYGETKLIDLGIQCEMIKTTRNSSLKTEQHENVSYLLMPRSSISKTPLIQKNSIGLIDAGYRGNLKAPLHMEITTQKINSLVDKARCELLCITLLYGGDILLIYLGMLFIQLSWSLLMYIFSYNSNIYHDTYTIKAGTRLMQIVAPSLSTFKFKLVHELSKTARESSGFGSTGVSNMTNTSNMKDASNMIDALNTSDVMEVTDAIDVTKYASNMTDALNTSDAMDVTDAINTSDEMDVTDALNTSDGMDVTDVLNTSDAMDVTDAINTSDAMDVTDALNTSDEMDVKNATNVTKYASKFFI
jgi:dUTPase